MGIIARYEARGLGLHIVVGNRLGHAVFLRYLKPAGVERVERPVVDHAGRLKQRVFLKAFDRCLGLLAEPPVRQGEQKARLKEHLLKGCHVLTAVAPPEVGEGAAGNQKKENQ